jgi:hypothetical protein
MAPKTVQQLFNLKPEEVNALAVLSGLEGYRGGRGEDVAAVAANVLARRIAGNWGGIDVRNIAKSPGQYEAVFDYSMQQLADPAFGAQKLGGEAEYNRIRNIVNDPSLVGEQFKRSKGAQSFKGVSAYGRRQPQDYMPIPGKSNYYHDPLESTLFNRGLGIFNSPGTPRVTPTSTNRPQPPPQLANASGSYGPTPEESMRIKLMQKAMQGVSQPENPAQKFINFISGIGNNLGVTTNPLSTPGY